MVSCGTQLEGFDDCAGQSQSEVNTWHLGQTSLTQMEFVREIFKSFKRLNF